MTEAIALTEPEAGNRTRTYEVKTYGCQMNVHDSERLSGLLDDAGYVRADAGDQADLRRFTTPQMYASIQHDLLERGGATQRTEVLQLDAGVIDVATENGEQLVSVRFRGLVREDSQQAATDFDEVWHLAKAGDGWLIAGIQQTV